MTCVGLSLLLVKKQNNSESCYAGRGCSLTARNGPIEGHSILLPDDGSRVSLRNIIREWKPPTKRVSFLTSSQIFRLMISRKC
jgi:hypothetical protein